MRNLLLFVLMLAFIGSATATDLGNVQRITKNNEHVGMNPGTPDGRQGGENMSSALVIESMPYNDTGNTSDNFHDYDAVCPYSGSIAPDVVYSFTPTSDVLVSVDLCGSSYDTKTYIMDGAMNIIDCNDDAYFDDTCGTYVSMIEGAALVAGVTYYIIIDGYGEDAGDYILAMDEFMAPPPCILTCSGENEGEPALGPGYEDAFNGGCNSPEYGEPFQVLQDGWPCLNYGEMTFCGVSGWTDSGRDTDWFYTLVGYNGMVEMTVDAEQITNCYELSGSCDNGIVVEQNMTVGPCAPGTLVMQGSPGAILMLWVGPSEYTPPAGFVGYEYNYVLKLEGIYNSSGATPTEKVSFDSVKSLYR